MKKIRCFKGVTPSSLALQVNLEQRTVKLIGEVGTWSVQEVIAQLDYLTGLNNKPIKLKITSPGGSVDHGLVLYDYIKSSKAQIHTECSGMAASMGAILLAASRKGKRTATKNARIMIHQPSSGYIGKALDIEIHARETARIRRLLNSLLSKDTGQSFNKVARDTELDLWMTAEEAKTYGLIDKII